MQNVCTASYTLVWHSWEQWETFLDWAALWGINLLPALTGQEEVQYKVLRSFGLDDDAIRGWFNGPALLTWSRGQNSHGSGVLGPLPRSWMTQQWQLQRANILPRMRALGIYPMLPAFQGNVPWALAPILQKNGSNVTQGNGQGNGTGWLDSRDPSFGKIADKWMQTLLFDFGTDNGHVYQMDGLFAPTGWGAAPPLEPLPPLPTQPLLPGPACEYGPEQNDSYIPGYASDAGKNYDTLAAAKTVCSGDIACGGVTSHGCDTPNKACQYFQTRSGMSKCPKGGGGNPCPGDVPKVEPVPKGAGTQNSYAITNTDECGHHLSPPPPPPPPPPRPPPPPMPPVCPTCPPCEWVEHNRTTSERPGFRGVA